MSFSDYARYTTKKAKQKSLDRYNEMKALERKDAIRFIYREVILRAAKAHELEVELSTSIIQCLISTTMKCKN
jgi:hypothetical protein